MESRGDVSLPVHIARKRQHDEDLDLGGDAEPAWGDTSQAETQDSVLRLFDLNLRANRIPEEADWVAVAKARAERFRRS